MPVTRKQYDAIQKLARIAKKGVKIAPGSNTSLIRVVDPHKNRSWIVDRSGKTLRV